MTKISWTPIIEDDVPLPPPSRGNGATQGIKFTPRLKLLEMRPKQSQFIPDAIISYTKLANRIAALRARGHDAHFALRSRLENNIPGTRVWRI